MIVPTVHLNGTPASTLLAAALAAREALTKAIEAVNETAPHGRDFLPGDRDGSLSQAQIEHRRRVRALDDLREEMSALADHVTAAIDRATTQREGGHYYAPQPETWSGRRSLPTSNDQHLNDEGA